MSKDFSTFLKTRIKQRPGAIAGGILLLITAVILGLWLVSEGVARLVVEGFWFNEVGYPEAFWLRLLTKALIGAVVAGLSLFFLFSNLRLANRLQHSVVQPPESKTQNSKLKTQNSKLKTPSPSLSLRWVLPIAIALSLLIGLLLLHYSQIVTNFSQFAASQPGTTPIIPNRFRLDAIFPLTQHLAERIGPLPCLGIAVLGVGVIALLSYPKILLGAIALILSLEWSFVLSANWNQLLLFFHATPFKRVDPIFAKDIGFYIFVLPTWQLLEFWLMGLSLFAFLAASLLYLLSANSLSEGTFPGFSHSQIRHLSGLAGWLMLVIAFSYWVSRYELLYSPQGVVFGAGYTDAHVQLPAFTAMAILACAIALVLFWQAARHEPRGASHEPSSQFPILNSQFRVQLKTQNSKLKPREAARINRKSKIENRKFQVPLPFLLLSSYLVLAIALTTGLPLAVQRTIVQPNELTREQPYIRNSIAATRGAFNLENIQQETFNPVGNLTYATLQKNDQTIRNIRLWDTRPLLQTNRQLQQIRPYYRFPDADIDRYALQSEAPTAPGQQAQPIPNNQQVLISARELDYTAVPKEAQTWVNEHLVYTHGYGFTLSPVNKVAPGGLPDYLVKDIGPDPNNPTQNLTVSSEAIRASIPIGHPRLYYGEITNTYILTGTQIKELDFPSGNDNIYNVYDGDGGIKVSALWKRWLFARYLRDWQMVLTKYFTPQTKLLFRRNINERVRAIAPFLRYDQDPYLVAADPGNTNGIQNSEFPSVQLRENKIQNSQNYLYWVIDAYTLSDHYPYSDPTQLAASRTKSSRSGGAGMERSDRFNYIRNSVKVVIDAYHGSVDFYVADPSDPIIQAWARIFPHLFKPLSQMPAALQRHIRYPIDLFSAQSERLMRYHMTDPQVFYNQEDQWQIPNEIYGNQPQPVEPYFLITNLPTVVEGEEFILLLPYTPRQRTNLTAWLAARSDGANYGKLLLYVFPKQQLVYGTEQIEARINQDPVISQKISLWNRQGSKAVQGNLLVIPIEQSLLYVEPLYLEAEQNSLPTLVSVIVAYENRIAMTESLEQSLQAIFQPVQPAIPAIVRPVE